LLSLSLPTFALAAVEPRQATWGQSFGPDGPWNTIEVSIGGQPKISLFPGRMWQSIVTTSDYCSINGSMPHCASGTYRKDRTSATSDGAKISFQPPTQDLARGVPLRGNANMQLETIDLGFRSGPIQNHSLALIETESQMYAYPGGTWYPIFTGCFSLGAPDRSQVFSSDTLGKKPGINATMIPWVLKDDGSTASSSFGLHYGAAGPSARMSGSLLYGGYDRNRVVGNVLTFQGDFSQPISLQDISIRVIKGSSPFESVPVDSGSGSGSGSGNVTSNTNISGLLTKGNSTIPPSGLPIFIDPCSPYLTLPQSTCDAIASHLPVVYNASLGLYTWNVSSPRYKPIVASASTLSFTVMGGRNTDSLTIHVPFRHLNLTLTAPFAGNPTPYFPCFTSGTGAYVLGRAFFQDAFLGANWEKNRVFLGQAPGPNIPPGVDPVSIQPDEETIKSGGNDWEKSWDGFWTALTAKEANGTSEVDVTTTSGGDSGGGAGGSGGSGGAASAGSEGEKGGLSTGVIVGIAVGAAVAGFVGAGLFFFWYRRKQRSVQPVEPTPAPPGP
ncbi:hypothetical protein N657DRAFT_549120, partial [Parathielavia appendiculata]